MVGGSPHPAACIHAAALRALACRTSILGFRTSSRRGSVCNGVAGEVESTTAVSMPSTPCRLPTPVTP
jgi:hypothetical protein